MTWFFGRFFKTTPLYVRHWKESWVEKCFYILLSEGWVAISYILNDFSSLIFGGGREAMCKFQLYVSALSCNIFFEMVSKWSMEWREAHEERGKAREKCEWWFRWKTSNTGSSPVIHLVHLTTTARDRNTADKTHRNLVWFLVRIWGGQ